MDVARLTLHPWLAVSPFYDPFDSTCTRLHYGPMTEAVWEPVVRLSEAAFRRVRMMRRFMRIWSMAKAHGCERAARIMAAALFNLRLPGGWLLDQPVTIFVPNDAAMAAIPEQRFRQLLDRRCAGGILHTMLGHTVLGNDVLPVDGHAEHRSVAGTPIVVERGDGAWRVNGTAGIVADLRTGPHRVCIVDRVLDPPLPAH